MRVGHVLGVMVGLVLSRLAGAQSDTASDSIARELVAWAGSHAHAIGSVAPNARLGELEPLVAMIGTAPVVSDGEELHMSAEPLNFRNLLFRFLVERMGFTAIAIESGITEGYLVNRYVLDGTGDIDSVITHGITFGFNVLPQERDLVRWMRVYNADPRHRRKIHFYGYDVSGLVHPAGDTAGARTPLDDALDYLGRVDSGASAALRTRLRSLAPMMNFSRGGPDQPAGQSGVYTQLTQRQRDELTATIADMVALFEMRAAEYSRATSERAYALAYRSAIAARQTDSYLRQVPVGWTPKDGLAATMGTVAISDRYKADNVAWIKAQEGPRGKVLVFAADYHIAAAPSTLRMVAGAAPLAMPSPMGVYLKRQFGSELVTIWHLFGEDASKCTGPLPPAPPQSLEGLLSKVDGPQFLLDLRTAPQRVAAWLAQPHDTYDGQHMTLEMSRGFDVVFFTRRITPAMPCGR